MHPTLYKSLYQVFSLSMITISITLIPGFLCSSLDEPYYANCTQPFKCGGDPSVLGELKYPFWGINRAKYCGKPGYELKCVNNTPIITISTHDFHVIGSDPPDRITVASAELWNNHCPPWLSNKKSTSVSIFPLNSSSFYVDTSIRFLTILYGCPPELGRQLSWSGQYSCSMNNTSSVNIHYVTHTVNVSLASVCVGAVVLPIRLQSALALEDNTITLPEALNKGFEVWLDMTGSMCDICVGSGGRCGYNWTKEKLTCYCPDRSYRQQCPKSKRGRHTTLIFISAVVTGVVMLGFLALISYYILLRCNSVPQNQSVEVFLKNYESLVPRRYTYANITKMTTSFKEKLGEGGYGAVFKGNLRDGRAVAVKVWKQLKGDGQEFVNEVVSICRTSHINIVPLLGFCIEGHKRALVYELMPNGSLEKYIHFNPNDRTLSFQKLFDIAVGIAKGLEYLHQDCNTRIVHFDIKPHNILLDAEFTPKISDFGLAKPFKKKDSIISMSGARGTAGYIAPEVFFRTFGGVSHKSDVYSFGMMALEMVGCTKRTGENVGNSSEMYFPQWIYKQLERGETLDCESILNEEEKELERKMILVGLCCIQTNPLSRPPMNRVVEMLEGDLESLQVPPMPILASPPRQQQPTDDDSASFLSSTTYTP